MLVRYVIDFAWHVHIDKSDGESGSAQSGRFERAIHGGQFRRVTEMINQTR